MVNEEKNAPIRYGNITWYNVSDTARFTYQVQKQVTRKKL